MYAKIIKDAVAAIDFAEPMTQGALSVLPLKAKVGVEPQYVLLDQALQQKTLTVTETSESGEVPYLQATNAGPWPVLIFDGEELVGAKQNRITNVTIMVGVGKSVLPVSCVEQGRWSHRSRSFSAGNYTSHPGMRREKEQRVREAMAVDAAMREMHSRRGSGRAECAGLHPQEARAKRFKSDQGEVWREVDHTCHMLEMESTTMAMADIYDGGWGDLDDIVERLALKQSGAMDEVVGVVVFIGGRFVCLDLLYPARHFGMLYPKLLRGYALEAELRQGKEPVDADPEAATLRLFAELLKADVKHDLGADQGIDLRLDGEDLQGAGLVWEDHLIQLSLYPKFVA